jgi:hypothetical protein
MKKEYISYTIIGIVAGLVIGFIIANWTASAGSGSRAANRQTPQASVNSSSQNQELPPDHPPIGGAESEPPLPANHPPIEGAQPRPAPPLTGGAQAGGPTELPSLDPLPATSRARRAEQEYKNIQLLKGVPADKVQAIMEHFKFSLGVDCTYCHVENQFEKDSKPMKKVAREMITLTRNNNKAMGGAGQVTCFTCHRGQPVPPKP